MDRSEKIRLLNYFQLRQRSKFYTHYAISSYVSAYPWVASNLKSTLPFFTTWISFVLIDFEFSPWDEFPYKDATERTTLDELPLNGFLSKVLILCLYFVPISA